MNRVPPDLSTPPPDPSRRDHPNGSHARRKLPIGIQTLRTIRTDGHYYVDKTPHGARLLGSGSRYFLSRPRRFGKSLLVDTLKSLFEAQEDLFRGLAIHDSWDWSLRHPVLKLDFAGGDFSTAARLEAWVIAQLEDQAHAAGIDPPAGHAPECLQRIIRALREASGGSQVVVLVDEYDKPILDVLASPDAARSSRGFLRGLYGTLKTCDEHLRLVLLTGVSKFSKVNLFSGLNNLEDITLDPRFATICGYTDADLDQVFAPELDGLDRDAIRKWYIGYGWRGEPVYNPFDILLLFKNREFGAYVFELKVAERATPGAALEQLRRRAYADKHRRPGRPVHLVGIHFSEESRNIVELGMETA